MKILHLVESLSLGGAEVHLANILAHYPDHNDTHAVLTTKDGPLGGRIKSLGIPIHFMPPYCAAIFRKPFATLLTLYRITRIIKQIKPDVIHAVNWADVFYGRIAAWFLGIRLVAFIHYNAETFSDFHPSVHRADRLCIKLFPAQYYAVSQSTADAFERAIITKAFSWLFIRTKPTVSIIANGIDTQEFAHDKNARHTLRTQLGIADDIIVIGTVGRCVERKRFTWLIERFANVFTKLAANQNALLIIVGDGDQMAVIKKTVVDHTLENNIILVGSQANTAAWYSAFDIFALSSASESFGIVTLEAMAAGLPSIVTDSTLPHHFISNQIDGFALLYDDELLFEQRLYELITDASLRSRISHKALATSHQYDIDHVALKYADAFKNESTL